MGTMVGQFGRRLTTPGLIFGPQVLNVRSRPSRITLTNTGTASLVVTGAIALGPG